jgi:hypothetical protein
VRNKNKNKNKLEIKTAFFCILATDFIRTGPTDVESELKEAFIHSLLNSMRLTTGNFKL